MSQTTITLLFLAFAIISFILEKIPLGLTATIVALGGNLSIIGAPGNLMGVNALQELGETTGFFMYAPVGVPMLLAGIVFYALIGYRFLPDGSGAQLEKAQEQRDSSDIPAAGYLHRRLCAHQLHEQHCNHRADGAHCHLAGAKPES